MTKYMFYLHKRIFAQEYGRSEILDILARKTLKSIARSTPGRISTNRWCRTLEFLYRTQGQAIPSNEEFGTRQMPEQLTRFLSDFKAALQKYRRTHEVSLARTLLLLDYLDSRYLSSTSHLMDRLPAHDQESRRVDDMEWFGLFLRKINLVQADCGHYTEPGMVITIGGTVEDRNVRTTACSHCADAIEASGERVRTRNNSLILAEFAVTVYSSGGTYTADRRADGLSYNERHQRWVDSTWSPYNNIIAGYHSSKSIGFNVIDSPWFRRHRRAYGMELEIQNSGRVLASNHAAGKIHEVLNPSLNMGEYCFFERDGSIGEGFELITQPAGLDIHRDKMALFLNNSDLKRGLRSHEGGSCGLHIHVGRQYVTQAQIYRVQSFLNDVHNEGLIRKISRRYGNSYCRIRPEMAKLSPSGKSTGERYEALNVTGRETIEFRIFRGSLKYESVIAALEFVDSLLNFCMPGQIAFNEFNAVGFRRFIMRPENSLDTKFLRQYLSLSAAAVDNDQPIAA